MSSLSSASTLDQIKTSCMDNASYEEDGSVAKCKAFITACRILLIKLPRKAQDGGSEEIELDVKLIRMELDSAIVWLQGNDTAVVGSAALIPSFEYFLD